MTDHSRCKGARFVPNGPGRVVGQWQCYFCAEPLGTGTIDGLKVALVAELRPLRALHDERPVFGQPRRRMAGKGAKRPPAYTGLRDLPLFVYCPRIGVCGRGQHLDEVQSSAIV